MNRTSLPKGIEHEPLEEWLQRRSFGSPALKVTIGTYSGSDVRKIRIHVPLSVEHRTQEAFGSGHTLEEAWRECFADIVDKWISRPGAEACGSLTTRPKAD